MACQLRGICGREHEGRKKKKKNRKKRITISVNEESSERMLDLHIRPRRDEGSSLHDGRKFENSILGFLDGGGDPVPLHLNVTAGRDVSQAETGVPQERLTTDNTLLRLDLEVGVGVRGGDISDVGLLANAGPQVELFSEFVLSKDSLSSKV